MIIFKQVELVTMAKNFLLGLQHFLPKPDKLPKQLSILSIGCGTHTGLIIDEISDLAIALPGIEITYVGVDLKLDERINSEVSAGLRSLKTPASARLFQLDANDLASLEKNGIVTNSFDMVILRHPQFFDEFLQPSKHLVRRTIPTLLKKDGFLIVSLYADSEKVFFENAPGKQSLDVGLLKILYESGGYFKNSEATATRKIPGHFDDQHMYCYRNVINPPSTALAHYKVGDLSQEGNPAGIKTYIHQCVEKLGGKINPDGTLNLWKEYADPLTALLKFPLISCDLKKPCPSQDSQGFFSKSAAAAAEANLPHETALEELTNFKFDPKERSTFDALYKTISEKNYNAALRKACSVKSSVADEVIKILLKHGATFGILPSEKNSKGLSALDYADENKDQEIVEILRDYSPLPGCP